jgi:hypothetical protein
MTRVYRLILGLYPYDFRARFEAEMLAAFKHHRREPVSHELAWLCLGAAREWVAKWAKPKHIRGRHLPDLRMMRPVGVTREMWFGKSPARS